MFSANTAPMLNYFVNGGEINAELKENGRTLLKDYCRLYFYARVLIYSVHKACALCDFRRDKT
jgi:hypothetical protein